jgi:PAS domain S-box-containing protein
VKKETILKAFKQSGKEIDDHSLIELYRLILANVSSGVALIDEKGRFLLYNKEFLRLFGLSEESTINNVNDQKWSDWQVFDEKLRLLQVDDHPVRKAAITGNPVKNRLIAVRLPSGGDLIWMLVSAEPVIKGNGIVEKIICTYQDVTMLKQAQEALKETELNLRELIATKNKFFNIIAHDLKNPFTSLIGSSELLSRYIDQLDLQKIENLAAIINDASKRGYGILQNLLDWSRAQTGMLRICPEKINIRNLIDEHISEIPLNKQILISSLINRDVFVTTDRNVFDTIIRNLIDNAIKFTPRNGKIYIDSNRKDGKHIISVKDTGVGIPAERIDTIFRKESHLTMPGTENESGTGLGLKICREFVEKLNGEIWVESIENEGSTFMFSIPCDEDR